MNIHRKNRVVHGHTVEELGPERGRWESQWPRWSDMKYLEWGSNVGRNPQRGTPGRILMISRYEQDLRERERDIETEYAKDPEGKEFGWGGYHLLRVEMQVSICGATSTVSSMTPGMSKSIVPVA